MKDELTKMIEADLLAIAAKEKIMPPVITQEVKPIQQTPVTVAPVIQPVNVANKNAKGAGRHKRDCLCAKCATKRLHTPAQTQTQTVAPVTKDVGSMSKNELAAYLAKFPAAPIQTPAQSVNPLITPNNVIKPKISGYVLIIICNAVVPSIVIKIFKTIRPKEMAKSGLTAKKIKLDKDQIADLEPIADAAAAELFTTMSPIQAFMLSYTFAIGANVIDNLDAI